MGTYIRITATSYFCRVVNVVRVTDLPINFWHARTFLNVTDSSPKSRFCTYDKFSPPQKMYSSLHTVQPGLVKASSSK